MPSSVHGFGAAWTAARYGPLGSKGPRWRYLSPVVAETKFGDQ